MKRNSKKASEAYDGQDRAEIRHTAARSLGTEMVGHGLKNMFEMCNTESLQFAKSRPQRRKYSHAHPYNSLFQTLCLLRFSFAMSKASCASTPAVTASAGPYSLFDWESIQPPHHHQQQPQQQRWRGSTPPGARLQVHLQDPHSPSHQWLRRLRPSCSRSLSLSTCLHYLVVPRALSALIFAVNFDGFPLFNEALL